VRCHCASVTARAIRTDACRAADSRSTAPRPLRPDCRPALTRAPPAAARCLSWHGPALAGLSPLSAGLPPPAIARAPRVRLRRRIAVAGPGGMPSHSVDTRDALPDPVPPSRSPPRLASGRCDPSCDDHGLARPARTVALEGLLASPTRKHWPSGCVTATPTPASQPPSHRSVRPFRPSPDLKPSYFAPRGRVASPLPPPGRPAPSLSGGGPAVWPRTIQVEIRSWLARESLTQRTRVVVWAASRTRPCICDGCGEVQECQLCPPTA
jgi:hypothetical protein